MPSKPLSPETIAIHSGTTDDQFGSVSVPIYQTSTYAQERPGETTGYCYTRTGNPTRDALQTALADLEGGRHGFAFATGIAAENALLQALLVPGDTVLVPRDLYGGTYRLLFRIFAQWGISTRRADFSNPAEVERLSRDARLLWAESPTNPRLEVYDLPEIIGRCRRDGLISVVDNTFATPLGQRPLSFSADVVVHSVTKYLSGHSDVVLGGLVTDCPDIASKIGFIQNGCGAGAAPFDCWLALRGIRTFPLRFERHCRNAQAVAEWLEQQPGVLRTYYPGLGSHESHANARRVLANFGGVVSAEIEGGIDAAREFVSQLSLFTLAESLGGVKSLACHPASMTHASVPAAERRAIGLSDGLIRLSVGLESPDDLIADLDQALELTRAKAMCVA
jgi:cystathionine beta-lyase/cystathionine gamma-synthase